MGHSMMICNQLLHTKLLCELATVACNMMLPAHQYTQPQHAVQHDAQRVAGA
jgi:hypothetical protein